LVKDWRYSLGIVLILGLGIGPAATMVAVVDRILLRPLGYEEPHRLGLVRVDIGQLTSHAGLAQSEVTDLRSLTDHFESVEVSSREMELSLGVGEELAPVTGAQVTTGFFPMLGVTPAQGRFFNQDDLEAQTVIISHELWQGRFGGDPGLLGGSIQMNGREWEVVGIMPRGFTVHLKRTSQLPPRSDFWIPFQIREHRQFWGWPTLVRLADGVSFQEANGALEGLAASLQETYPDAYSGAPLRFVVHPLLPDLVRQAKPAIQAALVAVLLLLLTAVVNATALLVVALEERSQELAVRSALGAGRRTLVAEGLVESLILSGAGGVLGGGLAMTGVWVLRRFIPRSIPRWDTITVGLEPVAISAGLALVALLAVGLMTTWKVGRGTPWLGLTSGSGRGRTSRTSGQTVLVGVQVALAVALLFGGTQLVRSARELTRTNLNFSAEGVLTFTVPLAGGGEEVPPAFQRYPLLRDRLLGLPGVQSVGAVSDLPLSGTGPMDAFTPDLADTLAAWDDALANYYAVIPGYMETVRIPLRRGRYFTDEDNLSQAQVIIVDETLAQMAYPGEEAIGRRLRLGWGIPESTIVGVVAHARTVDPTQEIRPQIYVPFGQFPWAPLSFVVRAGGNPLALVTAVRNAAAEEATGRAVSNFQLLSDNVAKATSTLRAVTILVVVLALSAALLSALGLYAVVSYVVLQQTKATAIRGALGASSQRLLRDQIWKGSRVLLLAIPVGVVLSAVGGRILQSLVYGVGARDGVSLAASAALGAVVCLLAIYLPSRRAAKTDPSVALQSE
jgi:predicted permease